MDGFGNIDTTTAITNALSNGRETRSGASTDGTNLWYADDANGIRYTTRGSNDATQIASFVNNLRQLMVVSNTLYFSDASGTDIRIGTVGTTPPPITNGSFMATLPGVPGNTNSPFGFALVNLNGGATPDTLYFTDSTANNVYKYSLVGGTWTNNGFITFGGAVGLAAQVRIVGSTTNVDLFTTGGGATLTGSDSLWGTTDNGGYNAAPNQTGNSPFAALATAPASVSLRGITFAPVGGETALSGAGTLSVGPALGFFSSGLTGCQDPSSQSYSLANLGSALINWSSTVDSNWGTVTPSSGSLGSGGSITVVASFTANVTGLPTGTNTAVITFSNDSNGNGTTTRQIREIQVPVNIVPSTDFTSSGTPGGPFSPTNKVYTLTNGATAFNWGVTKTVNWLTITPTNGLLGSCAGVSINVALNTNANTLGAGNFSDIISFRNVDTSTLIDTRNVTLLAGHVHYFDDFSTFVQNTDLNGQRGWIQVGANGNNPLQVTNGAVVFPAGLTGGSAAGYQSVVKNYPLITNPATYVGIKMVITTAVTNSAAGLLQTFGGPDFIGALYTGNVFANSGSTVNTFANYRLTARSPDYGSTGTFGGGSNVFLGVRSNGQSGAPWTYGTTDFKTGQVLRVIQVSDVNASNAVVYVNPTSRTAGVDTPYVTGLVTGTGYTADYGVGAWGLSQFGTLTVPSDGALVYKVAASTNYANVYDYLLAGPFAITSVARSGNNVVLTWNGVLGTNVVQVSTSGNNYANSFVDLAGIYVNSFFVTNYTDVGGATNNPARYYRVKGPQ